MQTITINNTLFERYGKSTKFIQQYIFPGDMLLRQPFLHNPRNATDLTWSTIFRLATTTRTLKLWRDAFIARLDEIREQKFTNN